MGDTHENKTENKVPCDYFPNVPGLVASCFCVLRSEVREAAGIFLVFIGDEEKRLLKFIVMEFLKCDGGCDGGENWDVWREEMESLLYCPIKLTQMQDDVHTHIHTRTKLDWKSRWEFHLNEFPQLVKVLEWGDDLQHIQQP